MLVSERKRVLDVCDRTSYVKRTYDITAIIKTIFFLNKTNLFLEK